MPMMPTDPPFANHFRIAIDAREIEVLRISPLLRDTEATTLRDGGGGPPRIIPTRTSFAPIEIERLVDDDPSFEAWANEGFTRDHPLGGSPIRRHDLRIDIFDDEGAVVRAYIVHRAWVMRYRALPVLDTAAEWALTEAITLAHEGFARLDV